MSNYPYCILVVDDELDLHDLFKRKFKTEIKEGKLLFDFAENGQQALGKLTENKKYHLLFTDIKMPVMDGLTLLNHIKELKLDIKTVVVSAYDDIENIRTAMNRDAFDFLVKPIQMDDLKTTLEKTIREYDNYIAGIEARKKLVEAAKEKEAAILKERLRISRDLHDDIGATLSSISICAASASQHLQNNDVINADSLLNRINTDSRDMVNNMSDIVWLINPSNDNLQKLLDRISSYAASILTAKNIAFISNDDALHKSISLTIDERKNIFLILKEFINNSAKYSNCTEIKLLLTIESNIIRFLITDNGQGFNYSNQTQGNIQGNGIKNIHQRAAEINMQIQMASSVSKGTVLQSELKYSS